MSFSETVISVKNLSKRYEIYDAPRDRLKQFIYPRVARIFGFKVKKYYRDFWALDGISFDIKRGETIGIIGKNGSGKSTLLQVICGTLSPTNGLVNVGGRVAALLELGAGFNPEFTGLENIRLSAAIYGLDLDQSESTLSQIEEFAGIGHFLHQPIKTYSSGMYVRLAFAVAINVRPDILIIDEALAVGDIAFQAKCMAHLRALMSNGTTVLFVSHDTASVRNLCQKVLWINEGKLVAYGDPEDVVGRYVGNMHLSINANLAAEERDLLSGPQAEERTLVSKVLENSQFDEGYRRYGDARAEIRKIALLNAAGRKVSELALHERFVIQFLVVAKSDIKNPAYGFSFRDLKGNQVIGSVTTNFHQLKTFELKSGESCLVEIAGVNALAQGVYTLNVGIESVLEKNIAHEFIDVVENAITFRSIFGADMHNVFPAMVWQDVGFSMRNTSLDATQ